MDVSTGTTGVIDQSKDVVNSIQALLHLAAPARVFRSADGGLHARVPVGDRHEIYPLGSNGFRDWLIDGYFTARSEPPSSSAIMRVVSVLEARARFDVGMPSVSIRVARGGTESEAGYFIDLGDSSRAAIEVSARGWLVVDRPDAQFWRPKGMLPLPVPGRDGSIDLLRPYLNLSEDDFRLLVVWLTAALLPEGPYPILSLHGEQGAAKSTVARILRHLIDPQVCALLNKPASIRDLMVTAANGWLLVYDNITKIPDWLSDGLCGIVYGTGYAGRALFSDNEREVIQAHCPVVLNGIEEFVVKSDLADRTVFLHMSPIYQAKRRAEKEFWPSFRAEHSRILGGVLDAVVGGLRELPSVTLTKMPRMADFARWGEAVGRGLGWHEGAFLTAYGNNHFDASETAINGSVVAIAVFHFATDMLELKCSPTELLERLSEYVGKKTARSAAWPKTTQRFTNELRRMAPQLRTYGVAVIFSRTREGRVVQILKFALLRGTGPLRDSGDQGGTA
jgi:hypothetical protein